MSNLGCGGPGDSIDTHIVGVWNKKDKVTAAYPRGPQCPRVPGQLKMSHFDYWGPEQSNGAHIVEFCDKKIREDFFKIFVTLFAFI